MVFIYATTSWTYENNGISDENLETDQVTDHRQSLQIWSIIMKILGHEHHGI